MDAGAGLAVAGSALYYQTAALLAYVIVFLLIVHVFVVSYEEPTLRHTFDEEYDAYCRQVRRWWPSSPRRPHA